MFKHTQVRHQVMVLFREFHYYNTYLILPGLAGEVTPSHPVSPER
ncbi:hypothetical protein Hanom_Chr16g01464541 [Helianthus anomalus]